MKKNETSQNKKASSLVKDKDSPSPAPKHKPTASRDDKAVSTRNDPAKPTSKNQPEVKREAAPTSPKKVKKKTVLSTDMNNMTLTSIQSIPEATKSPKKGTMKSNAKDKAKVEELSLKLKESEDKLKQEKEEKRKLLEQKAKEIENKERVIVSIAGTNRKLMTELEDLKREVDYKLDKIGMKEISNREREMEQKRKTKPLELVIRVKERELENAVNLINILKKDRENLEKNLSKLNEGGQVTSLEDKLKEESDKLQNLENEIKALNKIKDEHSKCESIFQSQSKERQQLVNEMKYLKDKNKEMKGKLKETEDKNLYANNVAKQLNTSINNKANVQAGVNLPKIAERQKGNYNPIISTTVNSSLDLKKVWNMLESADKNIKDEKSRSPEKNEGPASKKQIGEKEYRKQLGQERKKFAVSLQNKNFPVLDNPNEERSHLFGKEERDILTKLLPGKELEKLEKKFDTIEQAKYVLSRKYAVETKGLTKKVFDLEERLEYSHLKVKEQEQRNKILNYQINEHKNENKILQKKLTDLSTTNKQISKELQETAEQNKLLMSKLQEIQGKIQSGELSKTNDEDVDETHNEEDLPQEDNTEDEPEDD